MSKLTEYELEVFLQMEREEKRLRLLAEANAMRDQRLRLDAKAAISENKRLPEAAL